MGKSVTRSTSTYGHTEINQRCLHSRAEMHDISSRHSYTNGRVVMAAYYTHSIHVLKSLLSVGCGGSNLCSVLAKDQGSNHVQYYRRTPGTRKYY
jgi:2-polyprenyl-3-methyl-5-hydroxy-6-metoxy-1,4-benzoquinol methylase